MTFRGAPGGRRWKWRAVEGLQLPSPLLWGISAPSAAGLTELLAAHESRGCIQRRAHRATPGLGPLCLPEALWARASSQKSRAGNSSLLFSSRRRVNLKETDREGKLC